MWVECHQEWGVAVAIHSTDAFALANPKAYGGPTAARRIHAGRPLPLHWPPAAFVLAARCIYIDLPLL